MIRFEWLLTEEIGTSLFVLGKLRFTYTLKEERTYSYLLYLHLRIEINTFGKGTKMTSYKENKRLILNGELHMERTFETILLLVLGFEFSL